jgi:hypothetical protein
MTVFACAGCESTLTVPVSRVALPVHAGQKHGHGLLGVLMEPGTYAVNPDPFGPPWQPWTEAHCHRQVEVCAAWRSYGDQRRW